MSGAQRLPNGGTLVCSTAEGRIFELDTNNKMVWTYVNPSTNRGILNQGDSPTIANDTYDNYVFRATKYPASYPAFDDKELIAGETIEEGESFVSCDLTLNLSEINRGLVYPNPMRDFLTIDGYSNFKILTMEGREVYRDFSQESGLISIPTEGWSNGIYFLILGNDEQIKLVKKD